MKATIIQKSSTKPGKIQCNVCNMAFFHQASLDVHRKTHSNVNTCQHCHRSFAGPTRLSLHLREYCKKILAAEKKNLLENYRKSSSAKRAMSTSQVNQATSVTRSTPTVREFARKLIKCHICMGNFKYPHLYASHFDNCSAEKGTNHRKLPSDLKNVKCKTATSLPVWRVWHHLKACVGFLGNW